MFFRSPAICSRNPSYKVITFDRIICVFYRNSFDFPRTFFVLENSIDVLTSPSGIDENTDTRLNKPE